MTSKNSGTVLLEWNTDKATLYTFKSNGAMEFHSTGTIDEMIDRASHFYNTPYIIIDDNQNIIEEMNEKGKVIDHMFNRVYWRT